MTDKVKMINPLELKVDFKLLYGPKRVKNIEAEIEGYRDLIVSLDKYILINASCDPSGVREAQGDKREIENSISVLEVEKKKIEVYRAECQAAFSSPYVLKKTLNTAKQIRFLSKAELQEIRTAEAEKATSLLPNVLGNLAEGKTQGIEKELEDLKACLSQESASLKKWEEDNFLDKSFNTPRFTEFKAGTYRRIKGILVRMEKLLQELGPKGEAYPWQTMINTVYQAQLENVK